jgi:hypothetical protein
MADSSDALPSICSPAHQHRVLVAASSRSAKNSNVNNMARYNTTTLNNEIQKYRKRNKILTENLKQCLKLK